MIRKSKTGLYKMRRRLVTFGALCRREFKLSGRLMLIFLLVIFVIAGAAFLFLSALKEARQKSNEESSPMAIVSMSIVDEDHSILGKLAREHFLTVPYVKNVHEDSLKTALTRLESDEIVLVFFLPSGFFEEARTGSAMQPIEIWLNPRTPDEAAKIGDLIRRFENAGRELYSGLYGYQKLYAEITGDDDKGWDQTTQYALRTAFEFVGRFQFARTTQVKGYDVVIHSIAGVLIVLAMIPAFGVLSATIKTAHTSFEERLFLASGRTAPALPRFMVAIIWWCMLVVPVLLVLEKSGFISSASSIIWPLFFLAMGQVFVLYALGRVKADPVTLIQAGWLVFMVVLILGGVLYPTTLFPRWLWRIAEWSPVYPVMRAVTAALQSARTSSGTWSSVLRPLIMGLLTVSIAEGVRSLRIRRRQTKGGTA